MKKTILLVLALVLVSGFVYAANVSGKLEVKGQVGFGDGPAPFDNNGVFTFEPNITGAVDEYNSVTIELRLFGEVIETNSRDGSTTDNQKVTIPAGTSLQAGSFFINSDIAGALGWTESTGGFNLKVKAGYFGPDTTEVGQVKSIVESSDTADFNDLATGGASEFTIGYTDYINLLFGVRYGDDDDDAADTVTRLGWFLNPFGKAVLGPGTLEYSAYFGTLTDIDNGVVGVGLEYNNIAVATDISIGIGAEFNLALIDSSFNYGANAVLDVSNWLDVDIALGGNQENIVNALGIGFILNNPSETLGLTLETEIGLAADSVIRVNPDLWFKAGAATYTAGIDIKDLGNFDETILDLFISLSF